MVIITATRPSSEITVRVPRPTSGLCSPCPDLPYCKLCKRHLPTYCFNAGSITFVRYAHTIIINRSLSVTLLFL